MVPRPQAGLARDMKFTVSSRMKSHWLLTGHWLDIVGETPSSKASELGLDQ